MKHPAFSFIEDALRRQLGADFRLRSATATSGGDSHASFIIGDGARSCFVKLGTREQRPMFEAEADGLAAIAATDCLRVPAVLLVDESPDHAFLVLEHLPLQPLATAADGQRFAEALAQMHRHCGDRFGWPRDNFIGRTQQTNAPEANWARFFVECRLRPQLALAAANGHDEGLRAAGERLCDRVPALFLDYRPQPSLVHGDLWHGNAAMLADGTPVVYDPAVHYGDRESDLAMAELFGGFPEAFYASYRQAWPLHEDHVQRKPLYCLYHLLNHLNLFGRGYLRECLRIINSLNRELSMGRS